jgi:hypothetical protein
LALSQKCCVAWQLAEAMKKKKISKVRMAALLKTSRTIIATELQRARTRNLDSGKSRV